jgi:hypothetical protein
VAGVECQLEAVLADQLEAQPLDPEPALAAQAKDQLGLGSEHLAVRRMVRPPAAVLQTGFALGLVAAPLAQGRPGDPATPADHAGMAHFLVEPDPAKPGASIHGASPRPWTCRTTLRVAHKPTAATATTRA